MIRFHITDVSKETDIGALDDAAMLANHIKLVEFPNINLIACSLWKSSQTFALVVNQHVLSVFSPLVSYDSDQCFSHRLPDPPWRKVSQRQWS